MSTILTGGAGFIGSQLIPVLLDAGDDDLTVIDNLHQQVHGNHPKLPEALDSARVRFVQGDVADASMWSRVLKRDEPRAVIHLAAETGTGQSLAEPSRHTFVNVHGTGVMLEALTQAGVKPERIVLPSSRAIYGEGRWLDVTSGKTFYPDLRDRAQLEAGRWEPQSPSGGAVVPIAHSAGETEPRPASVYAATKLAQEHVLSAWSRSQGVGLTVLRFQNVYGAGQAVRNPYTGVLTFFAGRLKRGEIVPVYEGGGIIRDFVHVSDAAAAIVAALGPRSNGSSTSSVETFDIGSGQAQSLLEVAEALAGLAGGGVQVTDQYRLGDVRAAHADISAANRVLGYSPKVRFQEGAAGLLEWIAASDDV